MHLGLNLHLYSQMPQSYAALPRLYLLTLKHVCIVLSMYRTESCGSICKNYHDKKNIGINSGRIIVAMRIESLIGKQ